MQNVGGTGNLPVLYSTLCATATDEREGSSTRKADRAAGGTTPATNQTGIKDQRHWRRARTTYGAPARRHRREGESSYLRVDRHPGINLYLTQKSGDKANLGCRYTRLDATSSTSSRNQSEVANARDHN